MIYGRAIDSIVIDVDSVVAVNQAWLSSPIDIGQNVAWKITRALAQVCLVPYTTFSTHVLSLQDTTSLNSIPEMLRKLNDTYVYIIYKERKVLLLHHFSWQLLLQRHFEWY